MGAGVASPPLPLFRPIVPKGPSAARAVASAVFASPSSSNRLSVLSNPSSAQLPGCQSSEFSRHRPRPIQRACTASFGSFSNEEFSDQREELARRMGNEFASCSGDGFSLNGRETDAPNWEDGTNSVTSIERKASCVDLPVSVRMLKRKLQWQEGFREAGETAYCSIKTAFSSTVFIVREIQSYALQMREIPLYEDLQSLLVRVQEDMNASFVWLFQRVFSQTPTLMVYLMILLANYSVHSMGCSPAIAAPPPALEAVSMVETQESEHESFGSSPTKAFSISTPASGANSTSVGGRDGGGGGNFLPGISGTDGEGHPHPSRSGYRDAILPNEFSMSSSLGSLREEEVDLWKAIVEEASKMEAAIRDEALDRETVANFVSPVIAKLEADEEHSEYSKTEVLYQIGLSQDPNNQLLLANYAQFLYLVTHDYDRAEEYFKKAVAVDPPDAEAFNKYATFLWRVRNDLWAAEETFLEAISADPTNSFYAANYAHFLWNTGGEDTCYPLAPPDQDNSYSQEA
ncbi:uncharacterized protein LOC116199536 [Punica granatum]|uniref:Uncharacterized protein n=2 Tax=Punica granatum TaxID=22663 RepID=A0A218W2E0_PUNGR|nr:uncharacterized protein LOC116199536 [Punica granatum]XP_031385778.1 uncharacterized protein LOC116199536 [Punica granatum]OWM66713.1 hypothetical protein CDL15_Pgr010364 [Punica granatum]PKI32250.1 hypothetical protein CRG98_047336 [Punica granatum]